MEKKLCDGERRKLALKFIFYARFYSLKTICNFASGIQ